MKVLVAGDFCPQNRVVSCFEKEDYATVFGSIRTITSKADFSIVNLECPIIEGSERPIAKFGPNLSCSEKGLKAIKWAGFNCVCLANNHFLDYGEAGVASTIEYCKRNELDFVGGGMNLSAAQRVLYKKIGDKVLAIINCCEHEFSIATETKAGSNPLNPVWQYYAIQEARVIADYVIVIVHGGHEHFQLPSPRMVDTYRFFIDAGADAVINHHQHCFSGFEEYHKKPIVYGLGNFCFDEPDNPHSTWVEGYAVTLCLNDNETSFEIHQYRQCAEYPQIELLPHNPYSNRLVELNNTIQNASLLQVECDKYYSYNADEYGNIFEPIRNRYYLGAKKRHWLPSFICNRRRLIAENYISCESHRDRLLWWFGHHNN